MKDTNMEGLNYMPFLSQPSPPSSGRTCLNSGGSTTRRSNPKSTHRSYNGNYEGDFTMFPEPTHRKNLDCGSTPRSVVEQLLDGSLDLGLEQHFHGSHQDDVRLEEEPDVSGDEDNTTSDFMEKREPEQLTLSYWQQYKENFFTLEQCKKIDATLDAIQQNTFFKKLSFAVNFLYIIVAWILRLVLLSVVRVFNMSCSSFRSRNLLRNTARRVLWWMTLAKCDDWQFFGLVLLLSPLVFLVAIMGFLYTLYCGMKNGIEWLVKDLRYRLDVKSSKFD